MKPGEIFVTYCSYISEPGKDYRSHKQYLGSVEQLTAKLKDVPLSDFEIHMYGGSNPDHFIALANRLKECWTLARPYANNMS